MALTPITFTDAPPDWTFGDPLPGGYQAIDAATLLELQENIYDQAIADTAAALASHGSDSTSVHGIADTTQLATIIPVVTALPGSPTTGDQVFFQTAAMKTAGVGPWHLRYDSTISGSYKWAVIAAIPLVAEVDTDETTTSTSYADLATTGPSITVPLAGDYYVDLTVTMWNTFNGTTVQASYAVGASAAADTDCVRYTSSTPGPFATPTRRRKKTGLAASAVIQAKYKTGAGTAHFLERQLSVTPVRLG